MTALTPWEKQHQQYSEYVSYIQDRCERPGTRAALRSGLRRTPEQALRMHAVVASRVPQSAKSAEERAYYTVAALIASQSRSGRDAAGRERAAAERQAEVESTDARPLRRRSLGRALADLEIHTRAGRPVTADVGDRTHDGNHDQGGALTPLERRLHALSRQSLDGLHRQLPTIVLRLRDARIPVDWAQLLADLARWPLDRDRITKRWMQDYYRHRVANSPTQNESPSSEGTEA